MNILEIPILIVSKIVEIILMFFAFCITHPIVLILILIFDIILYNNYRKIRGYMGEFWVKQALKKLPKDKYIVLNDIMIKQNNNTHQIDHLIISPFGIFVIEMKNYYGLIIGNEYKDKWIQYLGKKKSYFYNPIHQNYGHVKALEELLNLDNNVIIPIVCFSNQAKLKIDSKSTVTQLDFLVKNINKYQNIILESNLEAIQNKITEVNITDNKEKKKNIKNIKNKINEDNKKENNMICPKCGGKLIIRNGKYSKFIGCSNYPKCRFTKKYK